MKPARNILTLLLFATSLASCIVSDYTRTTKIEIMKPGMFNFPENVSTVAIINRGSYINDTIPFRYFNGTKIDTDTTVKYKTLSNVCVDALASFLEKERYFRKVINYRDSLNSLNLSNERIINPEELFQKTKSDICILLDFFDFSIASLNGFSDVVANSATLSWTIAIKTDTLSYLYNQVDTLIYEANEFPLNFNGHKRLQMIVNNSSEYLGKSFGSKIIPTWLPVERLYYKSNNQSMLLAEKYALNNDWLKAAEIWNAQTKNKNVRIVAKASYNMALACEMEGKPDAAIDWLVRSYSCLNENNEEHKANCQRYIAVLALRKKEIEKLGKQVRNN